jgi:hypothetical protein
MPPIVWHFIFELFEFAETKYSSHVYINRRVLKEAAY